jgi:hypothetical protein
MKNHSSYSAHRTEQSPGIESALDMAYFILDLKVPLAVKVCHQVKSIEVAFQDVVPQRLAQTLIDQLVFTLFI